jgi:hypothetical protein
MVMAHSHLLTAVAGRIVTQSNKLLKNVIGLHQRPSSVVGVVTNPRLLIDAASCCYDVTGRGERCRWTGCGVVVVIVVGYYICADHPRRLVATASLVTNRRMATFQDRTLVAVNAVEADESDIFNIVRANEVIKKLRIYYYLMCE